VVEVDPMKPMLIAPGIKHLKLKCDILVSTFAFKFHLHRYTEADCATDKVERRHLQREGRMLDKHKRSEPHPDPKSSTLNPNPTTLNP
jgi:hypothetical protein